MTSYLFLISAPTLSATPYRYNLPSGTSVAIKCETPSTGAPITYNFYLNRRKITSQSGDTYTIESISKDESGGYKCTVTMNDMTSEPSSLLYILVDGKCIAIDESIVKVINAIV